MHVRLRADLKAWSIKFWAQLSISILLPSYHLFNMGLNHRHDPHQECIQTIVSFHSQIAWRAWRFPELRINWYILSCSWYGSRSYPLLERIHLPSHPSTIGSPTSQISKHSELHRSSSCRISNRAVDDPTVDGCEGCNQVLTDIMVEKNNLKQSKWCNNQWHLPSRPWKEHIKMISFGNKVGQGGGWTILLYPVL